MKKAIFLAIFTIFLLTGCGAGVTETLSCSYDNEFNNISTRTVYSIDYEDSEVKKVRVTYKYRQNEISDNMEKNDNDGIVDGVVGSAIDNVINGVTDVILDVSGLRSRHMDVQNMYGNINGFSVQNTNDMDDLNYTVTYVIDYDQISDNDLATLNLYRDINTMRSNYIQQGFTCQ